MQIKSHALRTVYNTYFPRTFLLTDRECSREWKRICCPLPLFKCLDILHLVFKATVMHTDLIPNLHRRRNICTNIGLKHIVVLQEKLEQRSSNTLVVWFYG